MNFRCRRGKPDLPGRDGAGQQYRPRHLVRLPAPQTIDLLQQAVDHARAADSVVLVIGETADAGLESIDRDATALPAHQVALIRAVCAANPRTVVVLNVAHPVDTGCLADAAAVMVVWYPGQEFGPALASVLAGDREPGGRLPVTFAQRLDDYPVRSLTPDAAGDLWYHERQQVGYRWFNARERPAAWAFGHGLGYADITLIAAALTGDEVDALQLRCRLENRAARAGKAVVQLYLRGPETAWSALAEFAAVSVPAHDEAALTLVLPRHALQRWQVPAQEWHLASGPGSWRWVSPATISGQPLTSCSLPTGKSATGAKPGPMAKRVGNVPALFFVPAPAGSR